MLSYSITLVSYSDQRIQLEAFLLDISLEIRQGVEYSIYIHVGKCIETNPFNNLENVIPNSHRKWRSWGGIPSIIPVC